MYRKKLLILSIGLGLTILSWGKGTFAKPNKSTLTTGISATNKAATPVTNISEGLTIRRGTGFQAKTVDGVDILIPQDVFEAIITSAAYESPNKTSEQILICLTDSCGSSNNSGSNSISVNELAELVESDLNQAFRDLVAAQQAESADTVATDNSRRIVRSESDAHANCGCIPGETKIVRELTNSEYSNTRQNVMSVSEARQIVETKLEESSTFVEQINQFKPENSLW